MWKQKIYKSLFSILLTGICVTAVTYAASVSYIKDGEVLTESYMTSLVSAINGKANLSEVYTKAQVDAKIEILSNQINNVNQTLNWKIISLENRLDILENSNTESTPIVKQCPAWYMYDDNLNKCIANSICSISSCPGWYKLDVGICKCIPNDQSYR